MRPRTEPEPMIPSQKGTTEVLSSNVHLHCERLEIRLEALETERRELAAENRQLHRDKEILLRENGELREKVARLEECKHRYELTHGFPAENSKVGS